MQPANQAEPNQDQPLDDAELNTISREPSTGSVASTAQEVSAPAAETVSTVETPVMAATPVPQAKSSKKKPIIIGVIIALVLALFGGSAWALTWYQDPDKVVTDGIGHSILVQKGSISGNITLENDEVAVAVKLDSKSNADGEGTAKAGLTFKLKSGELAGKDFAVDVDVVSAKKGQVGYVKLSNVQEAFDGIIDGAIDAQVKTYQEMGYTLTPQEIAEARTQAKAQFSGIISKIDNQWIKIEAKDDDSDEDDSVSCMLEAFQKINRDSKALGEVKEAYEANRFIIVKENLGSKDGSFGYLVALDRDTAQKFGNTLKNTELGKAVAKCSKDTSGESSDTSGENPIKDGRFELWVDEWSHQITRIVFKAKISSSTSTDSDMSLSGDIEFDYKSEIESVKEPTDAKSIDEIQKDLESITGAASQSLSI